MTIQDDANAAYRIKAGAKEVQMRTVGTADALHKTMTRLGVVVAGSKTGLEALQQVRSAECSLRDCAAKLLTLQTYIDHYISDLTK